jgi:putative ABC transport system ATP-binding protein
MLNLAKIGKTFHTDDVETRALSSVELAIDKGEFVSINGPSGSGKSTLLSILGLLDVPSQGEYKIDGTDTAKLDPIARAAMRNKAIGFIFQAFNLIGDLTVEENVELPLVYRGMAPAERKAKVTAALDSVRMSHRARHLPGQLSGGQQQRVAVARAVAGDPLILLADEPTGNLDSKNGDAVMELLEELHAAGATICMVTHNPDYAKKASRIVHLFDGRIVEDRKSA